MIVWKSDILYSTDKKGSQKQWVVEVHDLGGESYGVRRTFGQVGGKMQTSEKIVKSGKNIGKANETTPKDQAILEAKALFKKKQPDDKILPMLAGTWTPKSKLSSKVYVQPKLDGIRLMLGRRDGKIVMMTRTGKPVTGMEQALSHALFQQLAGVNLQLWQVEDELREFESKRIFDAEFIELARSVYKLNDHRAAIKREVNLAFGSKLIEEKSYKAY